MVERRDGKPGFQLMWDFWAGGHGLQEQVGENCKKLRQAYAVEVAEKAAKRQGLTVKREMKGGKVILVGVEA